MRAAQGRGNQDTHGGNEGSLREGVMRALGEGGMRAASGKGE